MTDTPEDDATRLHVAQVDAVTLSVAKLLPTLGSKGFAPEAIFEGAIKGAAIVMIEGRQLGAVEIADLLSGFADAFRANPRLDRGKLHVVE